MAVRFCPSAHKMNHRFQKKFYSRLAKIEEKKSLKKAFIFTFLTISLLGTFVFFGLPFLINLAVFLGDRQENSQVLDTDNLAPQPPRFEPIAQATKEPLTTLRGYSESESIVELFLNGISLATTTTSVDGTFKFENINLNDGENTFYGISSDRTGNKSSQSERLNITLKKTGPKLEISEPADNSTLTGEKKRRIKIIGRTEEDVVLTLNEKLIILNQDGSFNTEFSLVDGENALKFTATDKADNQTEKEIKINFVL